MKVKKLMMLLLALTLIVSSMVGCGGSDNETSSSNDATTEAKEEPKKEINENEVYYTVGMHINIPYWQDHKKGLEGAAAELGVKSVFTGESGNDAANQVTIFDQVVAKSPAGILVSPIDPDALTPSINKAIDQGIPVVTIDSDAADSKRLTYFGTGNYEAGWQAAEILAEAVGEKGEVGILTIPGIFCLDERQRGFEECIAQNYPDMEVVSVQNDEGDPSKAANVTAQMLQAKPNLVGIFGDDAASGVGAAAALREAGKIGDVKVVAFDKDSAVIDLVSEGVIEATMVQRTYTMSYYATKFLYDYNHKNIKMASDMSQINPLPEEVDTGIMVVTKENADVFK